MKVVSYRDKVLGDRNNMSNTEVAQGIVEVINQNEKNNLYSFKVGDDWIGAGKFEPKFKVGDEIKFGYKMNGKWLNLEFGTVEIVAKGKAPPTGGSQSTPTTTSTSAVDWDGKDKRITFLACRKDALSLVAVAASTDSISLPAKKADRLAVLEGFVKEMTNSMYGEVYDEPFKEEDSPFDD